MKHDMVGMQRRKQALTSSARKAIAEFVNDNLDNMGDWLFRVANGMPKLDGDKKVIVDGEGSIVWLVKPDPATAIKCLSDICEYHLPKLSRSESTLVARVESVDAVELPSDELKRRLLVSLGLDAEDAVEIEPQWLQPLPVEKSDG